MVVAGSAGDGDGIQLAVAGFAAQRCRQIDGYRVTPVPVRSPTAMLSAPPSVEPDLLDAIEVHRYRGDVAGEQRMRAVGGDADAFGDIRAVEQERVGAALTIDRVVAVTRVPDEQVVAGSEQGDVVAAAAGDQSLPSPPLSRSAPWLPVIVSFPAPPSMASPIVPAARPDASIVSFPPPPLTDQEVAGFRMVDGDRGGSPRPRPSCRPLSPDLVVPAGAVDGHRVSLPVSGARHVPQVDRDLAHICSGQVVDGDVVGAAERVERICSTPFRSIVTSRCHG